MKNEKLELLDVSGMRVMTADLSTANGNIIFPRSGLQGVYILRSVNGSRPLTLKLVL
jgi:hypothetical protein